MKPLGRAEVADNPRKVDLREYKCGSYEEKKTRVTLERRVGLELLKLFMRYQIDLRILVAKQ